MENDQIKVIKKSYNKRPSTVEKTVYEMKKPLCEGILGTNLKTQHKLPVCLSALTIGGSIPELVPTPRP